MCHQRRIPFSMLLVPSLCPYAWAVASDEKPATEDTAVLTLVTEQHATVSIDGRDYATQRRFSFSRLKPGKRYRTNVAIAWDDGTTVQRRVYLMAGWKIVLPQFHGHGDSPEPYVQRGHFGDVTRVSFSPSGNRVIVEGIEGAQGVARSEAILWDLGIGKQLSTFRGYHFAFHPDGDKIAYLISKGTIVLQALKTGERITSYATERRYDSPRDLAFSRDGEYLIASVRDVFRKSSINVWETETGTQLKSFSVDASEVSRVWNTQDGSRLIAECPGSWKAYVWDFRSGRQIPSKEGQHFAYPSRDGRLLVTSSGSTEGACPIVVQRLHDGERVCTLDFDDSSFGSGSKECRFSPNDDYVLVFGSWGQMLMFDSSTGKLVREFTRKGLSPKPNTPYGYGLRPPIVAEFSPDGSQLLAGYHDGTIILFDTSDGREIRRLNCATLPMGPMALSPDGTRLLVGVGDNAWTWGGVGEAMVWDLSKASPPRSVWPLEGPVTAVAFGMDRKRSQVLIATDQNRLLSSIKSKVLHEPRELKNHPTTIEQEGFRRLLLFQALWHRQARGRGEAQDKQFIKDFLAERKVTIWAESKTTVDPTAGLSKPLSTLLSGDSLLIENTLATRYGIRAIALSPDGRIVATGGGGDYDNFGPTKTELILWDARTGHRLRAFSADRGIIQDLAFSHDGRRLVTAGSYKDSETTEWDLATGGPFNKATIWNVAAGRAILTVKGHRDEQFPSKYRGIQPPAIEIKCVRFSPDNKYIATGATGVAPDPVILWDANTGQRIRSFDGHTTDVNALSFTADGQTLVTVSNDGTAIAWDVPAGRKLQTFDPRAGALLSVAVHPDGRRVIVRCLDGTIRLFDIATGDEIVRLFSFRKSGAVVENADMGEFTARNDWLAITPEGLYDGTKGGCEKLTYKLQNGLSSDPFSEMKKRNRYPGLLPEIWRGGRPIPGQK